MILHTVNKSPSSSQCLAECLAVCVTGDAILLLEDGVYAALPSPGITFPPTVKLYALQSDLEIRGLGERVPPTVTCLDDQGFVALTTRCDQVVSWY